MIPTHFGNLSPHKVARELGERGKRTIACTADTADASAAAVESVPTTPPRAALTAAAPTQGMQQSFSPSMQMMSPVGS